MLSMLHINSDSVLDQLIFGVHHILSYSALNVKIENIFFDIHMHEQKFIYIIEKKATLSSISPLLYPFKEYLFERSLVDPYEQDRTDGEIIFSRLVINAEQVYIEAYKELERLPYKLAGCSYFGNLATLLNVFLNASLEYENLQTLSDALEPCLNFIHVNNETTLTIPSNEFNGDDLMKTLVLIAKYTYPTSRIIINIT
jgi:hypothetical protein